MIAILIELVLICLVLCIGLPKMSCDSRACVGMMSKQIYHEGRVSYPDRHVYYPTPHYPQAIAWLEAIVARIYGKYSERAIKVIYWLFYVGLLCYMYPRVGLIWTTILAAMPCYFLTPSGSIHSAHTDFPFSVLCTIAFVSMMEGKLFLSAVFLALCLNTKQEGIPFSVITIITAYILHCKTLDNPLRLWWYIPLIIIPLIPKPGYPLNHKSMVSKVVKNIPKLIGLIPQVAWLTVRHLFTFWKAWGVFWWIVVISIPFAKGHPAYLIVPVAYMCCAIFPVYMSQVITDNYPIKEHYFAPGGYDGSSFSRLTMHILPLVVMYTKGVL